MTQACTIISQQMAAGRPRSISVNVSARQFQQTSFARQVSETLTATGADPHLLILEITESLLLENTDKVVARMDELGALGVRFSIDDFGTGYSSLAYLKRLPVSELKIDQSFVRGAPTDKNDVAVIVALLSMAHHLGFAVVAEGVETWEQQTFLAGEGCDYFQGYLHHRPEPAESWCPLV